jgi:hypothetical protein
MGCHGGITVFRVFLLLIQQVSVSMESDQPVLLSGSAH